MKINRIKKIELICLYASHRLAFIDSQDHRGIISERHNSLTEFITRMGYDLDNRIFKYFLNKQSKLDLNWLHKNFKLNYESIRKIVPNFYFHPVHCTTCKSCHTGSSNVPKDQIILQRNKYNGFYICSYCEKKKAFNIDNLNTNHYFFTGTGIYEDSGLSSTDSKWLGFAGSRIIIKSRERGIILTNNLFDKGQLDKCFHDQVKHKINTELFRVKDFSTETLLKHLTNTEIDSIKDQLIKAKNLGHKI